MQIIKEQEKHWVTLLIKGDETAFSELYAAYKNRLMYFALRMLKSPAFAEDVYQDTFSAIWKYRTFLDPEAPFGPYVYTIMRNRILNMLTDIERNEKLKDTLAASALDYETGKNTTIESVISKDLFSLLESAIEKLTPQQQKVFRLSREECLSHKEIAQRLGISVNTVQLHISASLKTLRTVLEKHAGLSIDLILLLFCLNSSL